MAGKQRKDDSGPERAPINEHGLSDANQGNNGRNNFGLQDGLHPLQELDSGETTQTQKEEKEIQKREHEEQQEYYNQYRNPIARFRAQYPQAPAEFLAVRLSILQQKTKLMNLRRLYTCSLASQPSFPLRHRRKAQETSRHKLGLGVLP